MNDQQHTTGDREELGSNVIACRRTGQFYDLELTSYGLGFYFGF